MTESRSSLLEPEGSRPESPHSFDVRQAPFLDGLSVPSIESRPGRLRVELVVLRQHLRSLEIVHGGLPATLLDSAMRNAAGRSAPAGGDTVTIQLSVNYIRPVREG